MSTEERTVRVIKADKSSENSTLRVAAYCRVSTSEEDQLNSFITQMRYYHDFISQSDNMVLVDIYADEGITGTSVEKRNEFKRMLNDCRLGKIDRIYVKSVSRFARNALCSCVNCFLMTVVSMFIWTKNVLTISALSLMRSLGRIPSVEKSSGISRCFPALRFRPRTGFAVMILFCTIPRPQHRCSTNSVSHIHRTILICSIKLMRMVTVIWLLTEVHAI